MTCEFPWCGNKARSLASGLCTTHYEARRLGRELMLPVAPLLDFIERNRERYSTPDPDNRVFGELILLPELHGLGNYEQITLGRADHIACKVLKVHPSDIWGLEWFQIPTYDDTELEAAA